MIYRCEQETEFLGAKSRRPKSISIKQEVSINVHNSDEISSCGLAQTRNRKKSKIMQGPSGSNNNDPSYANRHIEVYPMNRVGQPGMEGKTSQAIRRVVYASHPFHSSVRYRPNSEILETQLMMFVFVV